MAAAERAHPDDLAFQNRWLFRLRGGLIPWFSYQRNPYRSEFKWRYKWANQYCSGKDVVDVPCGMGWGTSLIRNTHSLKGFDLCAEAIAEARQRYGASAVFDVADMAKLKMPDCSVDVVCCLEGIEHVSLKSGSKFINEAFRVLRSNGRLLISSPYTDIEQWSGNPYHIHEYRPEEIRTLLTQSFKIENCQKRIVDNMSILYLNCVKR